MTTCHQQAPSTLHCFAYLGKDRMKAQGQPDGVYSSCSEAGIGTNSMIFFWADNNLNLETVDQPRQRIG